jgi:putative chitinase
MTTLQKFQEKVGAEPDGSFGPLTLKAAMNYYEMTPERAAHFFGQTSHETDGFNIFVENLNYSSERLKVVFGKYFPGNLADLYARQPVKIASKVYGNRMGNGNEESREGFFFRGRGALQLSGRENYQAFADKANRPEVMTNPDLIATDYAFESALFFFNKNKLWKICDKGVTDNVITELTKRINGGTNGLQERISLTKRYYSWLTK